MVIHYTYDVFHDNYKPACCGEIGRIVETDRFKVAMGSLQHMHVLMFLKRNVRYSFETECRAFVRSLCIAITHIHPYCSGRTLIFDLYGCIHRRKGQTIGLQIFPAHFFQFGNDNFILFWSKELKSNDIFVFLYMSSDQGVLRKKMREWRKKNMSGGSETRIAQTRVPNGKLKKPPREETHKVVEV